jgi:hypothetical protein
MTIGAVNQIRHSGESGNPAERQKRWPGHRLSLAELSR